MSESALLRRWPILLSLALLLPALLALGVMLLPVTTTRSFEARTWHAFGSTGLLLELRTLFPDGVPPDFPAGDSMAAPTASTLRLAVNGVPAGPAHAQHAEIGEAGGGGYSHWLDALYFSPPANAGPRDTVATLTLAWPLVPATPARLALAGVSAALGLALGLTLGLREAWRRLRLRRAARPPLPIVAALPAEYRPDIDGLRAVALLLILDVHLGVHALPGSFLGVDIFFVISGYLISDILIRQIRTGRADLLGFCRRRLFRLLPASLVVGLAILVLGHAVLLPRDYMQFAESLGATFLGVANLHFLRHTGYFEAPAQTMPMLHQWSLAVEAQFYLLWPLLLALAARVGGTQPMRLAWVMGLVIVLSLAAAIEGARTAPAAAFFLPQNRFWEFAVGGLASLLPRRAGRLAQAVPWLGLGLLAWGLATMETSRAHPDWPALVPVLGAALVVHGGGAGGRLGAMLAWRPLVALGVASYSIYLWHWPLIALWHHYTGRLTLPAPEALGLLALALLLGFATWRWVELPWRRGVPRFPGARIVAGAVPVLVAAGIAVVLVGAGFPTRLPDHARAWADPDTAWAWSCPQLEQLGLPSMDTPTQPAPSCTAGLPWAQARRRAILWGDSTAEHLMPFLHRLALQEGMSVALVPACPAIISPGHAERRFGENAHYVEHCGLVRQAVLNRLRDRPDEVEVVLLASSWEVLVQILLPLPGMPPARRDGAALMRAGFAGLLPHLASVPRVVVISPPPTLPVTDPADCMPGGRGVWRQGCGPDLPQRVRARLRATAMAGRTVIQGLVAEWANLESYDPAEHQCDEQACLLTLGNWPLYRDSVHWRRDLPEETALALAERLRMRRLLVGPASHAARQAMTRPSP